MEREEGRAELVRCSGRCGRNARPLLKESVGISTADVQPRETISIFNSFLVSFLRERERGIVDCCNYGQMIKLTNVISTIYSDLRNIHLSNLSSRGTTMT